MRIKITIYTETERKEFRTAVAAVKYLGFRKAKRLFFNNEPATTWDLNELYQLELREKQHNKKQGL